MNKRTVLCFSLCLFFKRFSGLFGEALAAGGRAGTTTSIVTGANGYLGKAVVHELLQCGDVADRVLCLVRPTRVEEEEQYWSSTAVNDSPAVKVLPYDMLDGGDTLQRALELVDKDETCCVYHVASNFGPTENHKETALENVKGTEDVVRTLAAQQNLGSRKLVLTSSMAAVRGTGQDPQNGKFYTFEDWNTQSKLGANWGASYQWSKAESERRAIALAEDLGVSLVTLCPSFVFGPPYNCKSTTSYSVELVGQWVRGESPVQSRLLVDIRDAAAAHVAAGRLPQATGKRFIVSTEARASSQVMASWIKEAIGDDGQASDIHFDAEFSGGAIAIGDKEVDAEQRLAQELGVELRPVKDTIVNMAQALLAN